MPAERARAALDGVRDVVQLEVGEDPEALVVQGLEGLGAGLARRARSRPWRRRTTADTRCASASAASRSPTSSASTRWSRGSSGVGHAVLQCADEVAHARDVVTRAPVDELVEHAVRRARVVEVRGADADRARAREQHLDRVDAGRAHHRCRSPERPGSARVTSCTARSATGLIAGPDRPPPPPPSTGRRVSASITSAEQRVHERERRRRRRRPRRGRSSVRSVTFGESLAKTGSVEAGVDDRARRPRAVASGSWAKICSRDRARFGQLDVDLDRDEVVGARRSSFGGAREVVDGRDPTPTRSRARRARAARGDRARSTRSTPGPCSPTEFSIPAAVMCSRGAGLPAHAIRRRATSP